MNNSNKYRVGNNINKNNINNKDKSHALLSASSSHRWLNCPPSAKLQLKFEDVESEHAKEGSAAHSLGEYKLKKFLNIKCEEPTSEFNSKEMDVYTDAYVDFIMEQIDIEKQNLSDAVVLVEEPLDFSHYVPEGFGTGDCIIVTNEKLHIIDFKYGKGIMVSATDNSQMKLYALGALKIYENLYDIKEVHMTIFQPRRENVDTWIISVKDLKKWAENELKEKAIIAFEGKGEYKSGHWCTFCKAAYRCRKRAQEKMELAKSEFKLPPLLSDEEIEEILKEIPDLTKWASDIMVYVSEAAINHGKKWSGFKVVEGRSNRKYKDEKEVEKLAKANGFKNIYKKTLLPITEMEKLMGKKKFSKILGNFIYKPQGKLTLVPISDKREAVNTGDVNNEFDKYKEE